jgi:transposase
MLQGEREAISGTSCSSGVNAIAEGLNSKIATIQKISYGFRNRENFKNAIYFHCWNLRLYPGTHEKTAVGQ